MQITNIDTISRDDGDIIIIEINDSLCVCENRRGVRCDDGFALAYTDHDWAATTGYDDFIRFARRNDCDTKRSFDEVKSIAHGLKKIAFVSIADEMR